MGMNKDHTVEELLAEIADSAAREADFRNRAEVAEAKSASIWGSCYHNEDASSNPYSRNDENVNPKVYKMEDGHPWKQSQWPSLRDAGQCDLCTAPEHLHIHQGCGPGEPSD